MAATVCGKASVSRRYRVGIVSARRLHVRKASGRDREGPGRWSGGWRAGVAVGASGPGRWRDGRVAGRWAGRGVGQAGDGTAGRAHGKPVVWVGIGTGAGWGLARRCGVQFGGTAQPTGAGSVMQVVVLTERGVCREAAEGDADWGQVTGRATHEAGRLAAGRVPGQLEVIGSEVLAAGRNRPSSDRSVGRRSWREIVPSVRLRAGGHIGPGLAGKLVGDAVGLRSGGLIRERFGRRAAPLSVNADIGFLVGEG